jgi:spoIIIJ-associated protein
MTEMVSRETAAPGTGIQQAQDVLLEVLRHLGIETRPSVHGPDENGGWTLRLQGPDVGIVIGRHGQTLEAVEYLLNRIAFAKDPGSPRLSLDVEGYRERREEALIDMARRVAARVRATGVASALSPMSPRDRRVVHVALSEAPGVTTRSEGDGVYKTLVIAPES